MAQRGWARPATPRGVLEGGETPHLLTCARLEGFHDRPYSGSSKLRNGSGGTHRKSRRAEDHLSLSHCLWPWEHSEQHTWGVLYSLGACSRQKPLGLSHTGLANQYQLPPQGVTGWSQKSPSVLNQVMVTPGSHAQMKRGLLLTDAGEHKDYGKSGPICDILKSLNLLSLECLSTNYCKVYTQYTAAPSKH